jgi:predicted ATPase with chaperone activity
MQVAMRQLHLLARAYHRVLKLVHMSADLAGGMTSGLHTWLSRFQYRPRRMV